MEQTRQRNEYIKQAVLLARDSYAIGTGFSVGEEALEPTDIRLLLVPKGDNDPVAAYKKLNYLITNDLSPESSETLSHDPADIIKKYTLSDGFTVTLYISGTGKIDSMQWWRPLFDSMKVVDSLNADTRVSDDVLKSEGEAQPEQAEGENTRFKRREHPEPVVPAAVVVPEPEPEPEPEPVPEPEPEPVRSTEDEEIDENDEYWDFVTAQIRSAKHAINAESFIRANEILNVLRKMLIELICVRNGIESDFEEAIDYLECEEKDLLIKTYPSPMTKAGFISALSQINALFDRLA